MQHLSSARRASLRVLLSTTREEKHAARLLWEIVPTPGTPKLDKPAEATPVRPALETAQLDRPVEETPRAEDKSKDGQSCVAGRPRKNGVRSRLVAKGLNTYKRDDVIPNTLPLSVARLLVRKSATRQVHRCLGLLGGILPRHPPRTDPREVRKRSLSLVSLSSQVCVASSSRDDRRKICLESLRKLHLVTPTTPSMKRRVVRRRAITSTRAATWLSQSSMWHVVAPVRAMESFARRETGVLQGSSSGRLRLPQDSLGSS